MDNLKIYQICHHLITYFATLIFPKKSYLGLIFRNGDSIIYSTPSVPKYNITLVNLGRLRKTIKLHELPKFPSIT